MQKGKGTLKNHHQCWKNSFYDLTALGWVGNCEVIMCDGGGGEKTTSI